MAVGTDIGIDLGTASVLVYVRGKGVVLKEPSVVAFDRDTNKIKAIGEEARLMLGRTPGNIVAVRPLRQGVISDYTVTEKMLSYFINRTVGKSLFGRKPRISVCVPSGATEVEKKAVEDATYQAGAREVSIIEEPVAAAIGAGIDISKPCGNMIVDIGGGTADIAVISLGGVVVSSSIKVAGDDFDEAIVRFMRKKHNLLIGERTAEEIKINVGTVYKRPENLTMDVRGRNLVTGLPKTVTVTSEETEEALREPAYQIVDAVHNVLERTPPELAADISDRGIVLTGGGSLIQGLEELIEENNGLIWSIVKRFYGRGHEPEDLYQIGCLGFIKSIKRFNTDFEVKLSTYAVPYMIGEIKRYIRDDGPVKVSRSIKDLGIKIRELQREKMNKQGKEPKIQEIAKELKVDLEDVILAMEATNSVESIEGTKHINNKDGKSISLLDTLSTENNEEESITNKLAIGQLIKDLKDREKEIILLRYYKEKTQAQVAKILGISQVQVSRLERKILENMRRKMTMSH